MRPHVLVLLVGVAACRPGEAAPIDEHDNPAVVAAVKAMAMGETAHLLTTDRRTGSAADSLRGDELVIAIRDAIGKYSTPDQAARAGYRELKDGDTSTRAIVHLFNWRNTIEEAVRFNPAKPAALIYRRGRNGYRLLGATYTAPGATTEEMLDQRVPLSVGQWHQHVDLCVPKAEDNARWTELGPDDKPVFGPSSTIDTQAGCDSVAGVFKPRVFGWMLEARVFVSDNPDSIWGWETPKAETPKPAAPKPEAPKPEAPKPEAPKPEAPKPEVKKPRGPRPALIFVGASDSVMKNAEAHGYIVQAVPLTDVRALGDAITTLQKDPGVDSSKIGLVGMFAGAAVVLHRAQIDKRVKAVVEYYGVYRTRDPAAAAQLPPVMIVGDQGEARHLDEVLTQYNVPHETSDTKQAPEHVIDFLRRYLPPS